MLLFIAAFSNVAADTGGIVTSAVLTKTTFLSTETAQAKITLVNGTSEPITLDLGEIQYKYHAQGQEQEGRSCWRDCWRWVRPIAAGSSAEVAVSLPSCEVLSDPCVVYGMVMQYPVVIAGQPHVYTATLPEYRLVPDPKAVYRGVKGDLPVLATFGTARVTIVPDSIEIGVTANATGSSPGPAPPMFLNDVAAALRSGGVSIAATRYELDYPDWYHPLMGNGHAAFRIPGGHPGDVWRAVFLVKNVGAERLAAIDAAIANVRGRFGSRISRITLRLMPLDIENGFPDLWKQAQDDAEPRAQRLAALIGSGELVGSARTAGAVQYAGISGTGYGGPDVEVVLDELTSLPSLDLILRAQMQYQGTHAADVRIAPAVTAPARAAFRVPWPMPTMSPAAQIDADRPELYATGGASFTAALAAGLDPDAVALLAARERTKALAQAVGARTRQESMFVLYAPRDDDVPAVAVATTFSGGDANASAPQANDGGITIYHSSGPKVAAGLPIAAPDPQTTVAESSFAQAPPLSNLLRFEIEADGNESPPNINAALLNRELRRVPGVLATALTTKYQGQWIRFEILLPESKRALVARLAGIVQAAYRQPQAFVTFALWPFVGDCAPLEQRLVKAAVHRNWLTAEQDARAAHRQLRKLLLATVSPADEGTACYPLARDPYGLQYRSIAQIPEVLRAAPIALSSVMVFRTRM